ncbi:E3 ubiquitin-protein ligase NRDP1-like isoform X2 [Dinothrombium tinctorium]|uniref:E3 ubiquitin-protein ligase NRDP1-like isoform X2 n=1 Tax=Dinothrombium tinctorium TaxID=1965070 RepID=A0A3S4QII9_9ACAR|nr:E3 ubiquitin-protein ligase NRDP1-like isoform X2 [Dinothrombium tinctorium]
MGIDVNRFTNLSFVKDEVICAICRAVFDDPLCLTKCGHTYCKSCILRWLRERKTCPIDGSEVCEMNALISAPLIVKNIIGLLLIHCDYELNGCREVVALENLREHCEKCKYRPSLKMRFYQNVDKLFSHLFSSKQRRQQIVNTHRENDSSTGSIYYDSFFQRQRRQRLQRQLQNEARQQVYNDSSMAVELKLLFLLLLVIIFACFFRAFAPNLTQFYINNEVVCWLTLVTAFTVYRNHHNLFTNNI